MKQGALVGSRYSQVARTIKEHKRRLRSINARRDNAADKEREVLRSAIQSLLKPHLTEPTVQRIRVALVAHMSLSRGQRDPRLREVGPVDVFSRLTAGDILLLLNAYGDGGEYRKTPELERALTELSRVCNKALERRSVIKRNNSENKIERAREVLDGIGLALAE